MKPVGAISIRANANDEGRIGPNKRSKQSESVLVLEDLFLKLAPLPCSFDVSPVQPPYFQEFAYFDIWGGLLCASMNEEINARVMEEAVNESEPDPEEAAKVLNWVHDKYVLNTHLSFSDTKIIAFYPGSNLLHVVNHEKLDPYLSNNDSILIKPHPIMTDDGLRMMARRYGYGRIINPSESGLAYLNQCDSLFVTANSEIGLMAALQKKPFVDVTKISHMPKLPYGTLFRLFKDQDVEHNFDVVVRALSSVKSGLIMPWHQNPEERIKAYCESAMKHRRVFKSSWSWLGDIPLLSQKNKG